MKRLQFILLASALSLSSLAASAPLEVWLTPERKAALERISSRPYVTAQERIDDRTVAYRWTNGGRSWCTTQRLERVLGKRAVNAWQTKLDAKDKERQALLDDVRALKDKPTKAALETLLNKHGKK